MSTEYDRFHGKADDAEALLQMAADCEKRSQESFERSDTDGFLSQWVSDISAQLFRQQAEIAKAGGKATFTGLYEGERRVAARIVEVPAYNAPWRTECKWLLRDDEVTKFGRRYIPMGRSWAKGSRIQKQLGLTQRQESDAAFAKIGGNGKGLSGAASAYVEVVRKGDAWGGTATLNN